MKVIKETENYSLTVGKSVESGNPCYQLVHKTHGVIELETYIFPQALKYIDDLEAGLQAVTDISLDKDLSKVKPLSKRSH